MALDKTLLDPLMSGYKFYLDDLDNKKITGKYYDEIVALLDRAKQIADSVESTDLNAFYAKMQEENIMTKLADAYTHALTESSSNNQSGGNDDVSLLKTNIAALKNSIQTLKDNYKKMVDEAQDEDNKMRIIVDANPEKVIKGIEKMIKLGEEPGMTYPRFLRIQVEEGIDKAMEGHALTQDLIEDTLNFRKAIIARDLEIAMAEEELEEYKRIASCNKFNYVETKEWNIVYDKIHRKYEPLLTKQDIIYSYYNKILGLLDFWSLSYCDFAPTIMPWLVPCCAEKSKENTIFEQKTDPGIGKGYEKLLYRYFGLQVKDIINDNEFLHLIKCDLFLYSQELTELLLVEVYPHFKPFHNLPQNIIEKRASIYKSQKDFNPSEESANRLKKYYNSRYGEGYFEKVMAKSKTVVDAPQKNAAPWNLDAFFKNVQGKLVSFDPNEEYKRSILYVAEETVKILNKR